MATNGQSQSKVNRQPKGVPVGGQFSGKSNPESPISLTDATTVIRATTRIANKYGAMWGVDPDTVAGETLELFVGSVTRAGGRVPSNPGAYCSSVARNIAIRSLVGTDRTEVRQALTAYRVGCDDAVQALRRPLTKAEEDEIATKIRTGQPATRKAPPGFHRIQPKPTSLGPNIADDYVPASTDDFAIGSLGDQVEKMIAEGHTTEARRLAYSVIAERAGAPLPAQESITERHATAARHAVAESGGVAASIGKWRDGHVIGEALFAPFGEVDKKGKASIAGVLSDYPNLADDLWDGAVSIATVRRRPPLRS